MADEIIISDTIQIQPIDDVLCNVTASVMGATDTREDAIPVSVVWNKNETTDALKARLIAAYTAIVSSPATTLKSTITSAIGTDVPETVTETTGGI